MSADTEARYDAYTDLPQSYALRSRFTCSCGHVSNWLRNSTVLMFGYPCPKCGTIIQKPRRELVEKRRAQLRQRYHRRDA